MELMSVRMRIRKVPHSGVVLVMAHRRYVRPGSLINTSFVIVKTAALNFTPRPHREGERFGIFIGVDHGRDRDLFVCRRSLLSMIHRYLFHFDADLSDRIL